MALLELKEVRKDFGANTILQNVTLSIEEGDIYGVIGESGSGKTTLLNILTGFLEPTEGEVLFLSKITHEPRNLHEHLHRIKKYIGFTPQHNSYYPKLTVKENLLHFGRLYGLNEELLINNIKMLLQFTGLFEHRHKLAEYLSGGMQKRLDVSCSLAHKPKILVLDEPTADL
ncbi:MAG: ABC transporter ATP-binding protein, partial [Nanoarchaeota archaeon]